MIYDCRGLCLYYYLWFSINLTHLLRLMLSPCVLHLSYQLRLIRLRLICHAGLRIPLWLRHLSRRLYMVLVSELSKMIALLFLIFLKQIPDISSCEIESIWHFISLPQRIYVLSCWLSLIFSVNILISNSWPNDDRYSDIESFTTLAFSFLKFVSHSLRWAKNGLTS